jgi:branched-chain amino acid transport system substrate-binding protein
MTPPTANARMGLVVATIGAALVGTDCHVFDSVRDCSANGDCPLGASCNADGRFCETNTQIVFGALLPTDNVSAALGKTLQTALDLVASTVNQSGGLLGKSMVFQVLPDRPNEVTVASMHTFIDDVRVAGIFGGTNSSVALLMQQNASPAHVLNISSEATSPLLSSGEPAIDRYFFRTTATSRHGEALAMALFSRENAPLMCNTTFLVEDGSAFAQGYRDAYKETFTKLGGCLIGDETVPSSVQPSYASVVSKIVAAKPDCLLFAVFADVGAAFIREAKSTFAADKSHDWSKLGWISGSPLHAESFLTQDAVDPANPQNQTAAGLYLGDGDSNPPTPEYYRFRAFYNQAYGLPASQDTPIDVTNTYDAAVLLTLAVARAGTLDRVLVRDSLWKIIRDHDNQGVYGPTDLVEMLRILRLRQGAETCVPASHNAPCEVRYHGASSPMSFDDFGTVTIPTAIYQLQGSAYQVVRRYDPAAFDAFEAAPAAPAARCPSP